MLGYFRVVVAQWSERRQLRSEALDSWLPMHFFSLYPDLPPVAYHQFLPPVVKIVMYFALLFSMTCTMLDHSGSQPSIVDIHVLCVC